MKTVIETTNEVFSSSYGKIQDQIIENMDVSNQVISGGLLCKSEFKGVTFTGCVFYSCWMDQIKFVSCRFENCEFVFCKMEQVEFFASRISNCKWEFTRTAETHFDYCEIDRISLGKAIESGATVENCFTTARPSLKVID